MSHFPSMPLSRLTHRRCGWAACLLGLAVMAGCGDNTPPVTVPGQNPFGQSNAFGGNSSAAPAPPTVQSPTTSTIAKPVKPASEADIAKAATSQSVEQTTPANPLTVTAVAGSEQGAEPSGPGSPANPAATGYPNIDPPGTRSSAPQRSGSGPQTTAIAGEWPRFRGPEGDGVSKAKNLPVTWGDNENIHWKCLLPGAGGSSPIVYGDRVFLTYYTGVNPRTPTNVQGLKRFVTAVDRHAGHQVWAYEFKTDQKPLPFTGFLSKHGYCTSTPVTDGTNVYAWFGNVGFVAVSFDGAEVWNAKVGRKAHSSGSWSSPILYNGQILLNASVESDEFGVLEAGSGSVGWHTKVGTCWSTPVLVMAPGNRVEVVLNTNGRISGFDPQTGEELWWCRGAHDNVSPSIVAHNGVVYATGGKNGLTLAVQTGGRGDVSDSHVLWKVKYGSSVPSPIYHDGHLYVVTERGMIYCLKAEDGQLVNEKSLDAGEIFASPVLADGKLYVVSREKGTFVLSATPGMELLAQNRFQKDATAFLGSPAVAGGQLFLRSDRYLYCLGQPQPANGTPGSAPQ